MSHKPQCGEGVLGSALRTMVVRGYRADIDPRQLGYTLTAVIRTRPAPGQLRAVAELAQQTPEIAECPRITGDDCYIATAHLDLPREARTSRPMLEPGPTTAE